MVALGIGGGMKAPLKYYGSKQTLAPWIAANLPAHDCYVEVFGGSASVLWVKEPSRVEVYNDLDSGLVAFFRVLRNPAMTKRLQRLLMLTPYSREEWAECCASWRLASDDVEMARRWFVATQQAFGAHLACGGWSFDERRGKSPAVNFRRRTDALSYFCQRMAHVQVEHDDFGAILRRYDGPGTLYYLDPPYLLETRQLTRGVYLHEMARTDHERLLEIATSLRAKVVISGYTSELYADALADWARLEKPMRNRMSRKPFGDRTECLWISPNATRRQLTLFD